MYREGNFSVRLVKSCCTTRVPGWFDVPQSEIDRYASNLGPAAVKKAGLSSSVDCLLFWNSCALELLAMSRLALRYIL